MDQKTQIMFGQLLQAQNQVNLACKDISPTCPTDVRYGAEWDRLKDFVDMAVLNIFAASEYYSDEQVQQMITETMHRVVPAGNALLEGYMYDLANCTECNANPCPLRQRATDALDARHALQTESQQAE